MIYAFSGKKQSGKNTCAKIWDYLDLYYNKNFKEITKKSEVINSENKFIKYYLKRDTPFNMSTWQQKSFAHKLKQIICILTGCTMKQLENNKFKDSKLDDCWKVYEISDRYDQYDCWLNAFDPQLSRSIYNIYQNEYTYRETLQKIGTELFRKNFHPNVWINALFADYKSKMVSISDGDPLGGHYDVDIFPNWLITDCRFRNEAETIKNHEGKIIRINRNIDTGNHQSEIDLDNYQEFNYVINNNVYTIDNLIENIKEIMIKEKIIQI